MRQLDFILEDFITRTENMPDFLWNLIVIAAALILGVLIRILIRSFFKIYYKYSEYYLLKSILTHIHAPATIFIPLLMVNFSLPLLRLSKIALRNLDKGLEIALTVCFAFLLIRTIKVFEDLVYKRYDLTKVDNLRERKIRTQLQFIRKFVVVVIIMLTIAAVLLSFENLRKIGAGLLTGVGIGGIIIGFAAQKSLGNLLAGFQIAFTQPIRLDDVLIVENEWGRVEEITLTYVVLRIWDQRRLILPINYFIEKPFQNWTRISADILGTVFLYLDYTAPIEKIREEFNRLLNTSPYWDGRVAVVQVTDAKERTLEVRALMSAKNSGDAFDLRCYIRENLVAFIQKNYPDCLPKTRSEVLGNIQPGLQSFPHDL